MRAGSGLECNGGKTLRRNGGDRGDSGEFIVIQRSTRRRDGGSCRMGVKRRRVRHSAGRPWDRGGASTPADRHSWT